MMDREIDVGFVKDEQVFRGLKTVMVHSDELILIGSPRHPLARRARVEVKDLGSEPFVVHHQCSSTELKILRLFEAHGTRCNISAELWSFENVKHFIQQDIGLAIVPRVTVLQELGGGNARQHSGRWDSTCPAGPSWSIAIAATSPMLRSNSSTSSGNSTGRTGCGAPVERVLNMFAGVIPILATPFHEDEGLDLHSWQRLLEFMLALGVDGVTILGVLGESNRLNDEERQTLIETAVTVVGKRVPISWGRAPRERGQPRIFRGWHRTSGGRSDGDSCERTGAQ